MARWCLSAFCIPSVKIKFPDVKKSKMADSNHFENKSLSFIPFKISCKRRMKNIEIDNKTHVNTKSNSLHVYNLLKTVNKTANINVTIRKLCYRKVYHAMCLIYITRKNPK